LSTDKLKIFRVASNGSQSTILKSVRDSWPISRSGIVSLTGLPHAAVSRSVAILQEKGIITESPLTDTNGPRRKRGLRLNPQFGYCLAVEYNSNEIEGAAADTSYTPIAKENEKIQLGAAPKNNKINFIQSFINKLQKSVSCHKGKCLGVAMVDPGIVDDKTGTVLMSTILDDWNHIPIVQILEERLNLPVMLLNTSMAKIRAIDRLELNSASQNVMYVEYGNGIGCGLKLSGNYISGETFLAGELGHVRITDTPTACRCGGLGCLESVAALPALVISAKQRLTEGSRSVLTDVENLDGHDVLKAAAEGDRLASHIVDEAFDYLGRAVAGIVNVLNPQIVVFDHIIDKAGEEAVTTLIRSLKKNTLASHADHLEIRISKLDSHVGTLGGAAAILDYALDGR
jgi:predicted NBD/HSP70 family sugar kinase